MQPRHRHARARSRAYRRGGVNRLSFGVQSMVPHVLASLGRTHDPANVVGRRCARRATRGSTRSTSTSSTAPRASRSTTGQRTRRRRRSRSSRRTSARTASRRTRHAARRRARTTSRRRRPGRQVRRRGSTRCVAHGLQSYEISNWSRPGHECRHNLLYWSQGELPRRRVRGALAPRWQSLVERAHARALHRRDRRGCARRSRRRSMLDDDERRIEAPAALCCAPATACPRERVARGARRSRRAARRPTSCSRCADDCSRTRWRCDSADGRQHEHLPREDEVGLVGDSEPITVRVDERLASTGTIAPSSGPRARRHAASRSAIDQNVSPAVDGVGRRCRQAGSAPRPAGCSCTSGHHRRRRRGASEHLHDGGGSARLCAPCAAGREGARDVSVKAATGRAAGRSVGSARRSSEAGESTSSLRDDCERSERAEKGRVHGSDERDAAQHRERGARRGPVEQPRSSLGTARSRRGRGAVRASSTAAPAASAAPIVSCERSRRAQR